MCALSVTLYGNVDLAKNSPQASALGSKIAFALVDFDASYATGGEAITASDFGLDELYGVLCIAQDAEEYWFSYDKANGKIAAFDVDSEVAASTDLSGVNPIFVAFGR
jgi:hypothetical protein